MVLIVGAFNFSKQYILLVVLSETNFDEYFDIYASEKLI